MTFDAKHSLIQSSVVWYSPQKVPPRVDHKLRTADDDFKWTWMILNLKMTNTDRILEILSKLFETAVRTAIYRG